MNLINLYFLCIQGDSRSSNLRLNFEGLFGGSSRANSLSTPTNEMNELQGHFGEDVTPDKDKSQSKSSGGKKQRTDGGEQTIFKGNLLLQRENHNLQNEVLSLQKQKMEIAVQQSKVELERAQVDLQTARELAAIEIAK